MRTFIIDDDKLSVYLTQRMLSLKDPSLIIDSFFSANDALEALMQLDENSIPKVIFLDLNMPVVDGWQFLDALSSMESKLLRYRCSIYILTSSLNEADALRSKEYALVHGFIHKPITLDDIGKVVERHASFASIR